MTAFKTKNYLGRNLKKKRTPDKITPQKRSSVMSKIRSRATKFEQAFIAALKKEIPSKFKKNVSSIKGKPDIVFANQKICVFLDSDFWHGWQYPRWKHLLKDDFWRNKISSNRKRDRKTTAYLKRNGWKVLRFWEHSLKKDSALCIRKIQSYL